MWYTEKGPERVREKPGADGRVRGGREEKSLPRETDGDGGGETPEQRRGGRLYQRIPTVAAINIPRF